MLPFQVPVPVPPSVFDTSSSDKGKNLFIIYIMRKDTTSDPPSVVSLDPGNPFFPDPILHFGNYDELDLPITF